MRLLDAQLILADRIVSGSVEMMEGRISRVSEKPVKPRSGDVSLGGGFLAPGFVDLHVHGAVGHDFMEATEEAFMEITDFHLRGGTTSLTPTTVTASGLAIARCLTLAADWQKRPRGGSRVVGVHVEGPYISALKSGAQDPKTLRNPVKKEWKEWLQKFPGVISQMTLAPELPGAVELIRALRARGIIASAGHSNATEAELVPALKAGLNQSTHTFNCMSSATKRGAFRVAGLTEVALEDPRICCELIADGAHVAPTLMRLLFRAKDRNNVCLITDAMAGAGMRTGTSYRVGDAGALMARVHRNVALIADGSALAGSTLTMIEAVRRSVKLADLPLVDAVRMASLNPALRLGREKEFGSIQQGLRADLVWFDRKFQVRGVWQAGSLRFLNR